MSVEFLLLLAIFILLPLIERILRAARQRAAPRPQPTETPPPPRPRPPEPVWEPEPVPTPRMPRAEVPAAPPALRRLAESDAESRRARARALAAAREAARRPATARPEPRRRDAIVHSLRTPGGLRRAVVLMTILGPCRAAARPGSEWER